MKEDIVGNKNSLSSSKIKNISEIERAVDRILFGNKGKLIFKDESNKDEKQHSNKTELESFEVKNFSPENRKKESIYFVKDKKKSIGKKEKGTDSDKSKVRLEKLNKKSVEASSSTTKTGKKLTFAKLKKRFGIDKKKKETKNLSKKTTKELTPSVEDKSHYHLDEPFEKLSPEEARWLDQQIKAADIVKVDESKKGLYDITSVESVSSHKDMLDQPKHLEKLLERIRSRKIISKSELKNFFSSKRLARAPKISGKRTVTEETKPAVSSKELRGKKKYLPSPNRTGVSLGGKFRHPFFGKTKHLKGSDVTSDKLDVRYKQPSTFPWELRSDVISGGESHPLEDAQTLKSMVLKNLGYSEGTWDELDFYPLHEPFAYVEIIREKETLDKRYILVEVELSKKESQLLDFLRDTLTGFSIDTKELEEKGEKNYLIEKIEQILEDYMVEIDAQTKKKIFYFLEKQFLGFHKLEVLMRDSNIEDISCDGSGVSIFLYHRRYGSLKGNIQFDDEDELSAFVIRLAQKCGKH
ncbi:MAG: hypothetical protein KAJ44_05835, partial [Thermoplasmatales archaeon]|nr:hypothetical protein [Thermoplasmatales archaeon]